MRSEQFYFPAFLYLSFLYWATALLLYCAYRFLQRRAGAIALAVFILTVLLDLVAFFLFSLPDVTMPWTTVKFKAAPFAVPFPVDRTERPLLHKDFPIFPAALNGEFSAFDNSSFDRCPLVYRKIADVRRMLEEMRGGTFPLQDEIARLSLADFLGLADTGYDGWPPQRKFAYLNLIEVALEDITFQKEFYGMFSGALTRMQELRRSVLAGYVALKERQPWRERTAAVSGYQSLVQLTFPMEPAYSLRLSDASATRFKGTFVALLNKHISLYKTMSVLDYFLNLWDRYELETVNTYVRLKDYDSLAVLYEDSLNKFALNAVTARIQEDTAVSRPILSFYPDAQEISRADYFSSLAAGKLKKDTLYVERKGRTVQAAGVSASGAVTGMPAGFTYEIKSYTPNALRFSYSVGRAGYLFYSDCYDTYWKARVDKRPVTIMKAQGAFKALEIPAGSHEVEFRYVPVRYRAALYGYYGTVFLCVGVLLVGWCRKAGGRRRAPAREGGGATG